jgi:phosphoribosylformylglycinamidine cyclo-ligase
VLPVFDALQEWGGVEDREMWQTFNMGTGFFMVVSPGSVDEALEVLGRHHECQVVGRVEEGTGVTLEPLCISYGEY